MCRGPVTDINDYEDRIFSKGSSAILTMPQGKNGYIEVLGDGRIDYTGYYGVIIPKDESCIGHFKHLHFVVRVCVLLLLH